MGFAALIILDAVLRLTNAAPPDVPVRELFYRPPLVFGRDGAVYRTSEQARKYLLDQTFPAVKAPGTLRVFIAGGSVAMGFPLESIYGPTQLLKAGLDALDPGRTHEVINVGGFGYNSHRVARVVEEIVHYQPDALIVMTGHNEFLEKRFANESGRAAPLYRLRLYRLFAGLISAARGDEDDVQWEAHVVNAAERRLVLADYAKNLVRIAAACEKSGVKLILVTCPANIQDFRPYGPSCIPVADQEEIEKEILHCEGLESGLPVFGKWKEQCPDDALVSYEQALILFRQPAEETRRGDAASADALFHKASDDDPVPVRALSVANDLVRETAGRDHLVLADFQARLDAQRTQSDPLADNKIFFDHCHLMEQGRQFLAAEIIQALADAGLLALPADWRPQLQKPWDDLHGSISNRAWAQGYYRIGYESGVNMGRVFRGLDYAERALELDPAHVKARMLEERLRPLAAGRTRLTGD